MEKLLNKVKSNNFISASFWVFLGTGFLNFGNYLYHFLTGRMLGPVQYGALEGVISLLYILFVPTVTLSLVVVKYVAEYLGKKEKNEIQLLYDYLLSKLFIYGSIFTIILLIASPFITSFLHLPTVNIAVLLAITFFVNLFYILNKSVLQGMTNFFKFSFLNFIETFIKLLFGVGLVYLGFAANGAFAGIGLGLLMAFLISYVFLKGEIKQKLKLKVDFKRKNEIFKFAIPTFITTLALTSFFTTDVILVRHFFHGAESGFYSALSVLGKVIYFAGAPVILVVFPLASEYYAKGERYEKFLYQGLGVIISICVVITSLYFAFPRFVVSLLFTPEYAPIAELLGVFAVFISIYTICALIANFYLSIHKTTSSYFVAAAAILQIVLINYFHKNLSEVIWMSTLSCIVLLISLLLYYPHAKKRAN